MLLNIFLLFSLVITIKHSNADIFTDLGLPIFKEESDRGNSDFTEWAYEGKVSANPIIFEPPFLDFYETSVGEPKWEQIKLISKLETDSIHLLSVSSQTKEFHCSTIKEQILLPKSNTTVDIIFLSRFSGKVNSTLQIHTSKGIFEYKISGTGIPSPYRFVSFQKLKLPLNETYSAPIYFHNPHTNPIQIVEMYTSGGDVHLEFPTNNILYSKKVWIINPYETRTIMQVKIISSKIGNFTNFIRIRTNNSHTPLGFVLPIDIEISNESSFYILTDKINFGIMRTLDTPKLLKIYVRNTYNFNIKIEKIHFSKPNDAIGINYVTTVVTPMRKTCIATVTFSAFKSVNSINSNGNIIIVTSTNRSFSIPYSADVIHGSLIYDANTTKFYSNNSNSTIEKIIGITNTFDFSIVIYRISFPDKANNILMMSDQIFPLIVKPKDVGYISLKLNQISNMSSLITQFAVYTNVSLFMIPIFIYDGKLKIILHRPDTYSGVLDFGMVEMKTEHSLYFTIKNENPIEIVINHISSNWRLALLSIVSINKVRHQPDKLTSESNKNFKNKVPLLLKPYQFAIFQLKVSTPDIQGVFAYEVKMQTQFENISIPYYLRTNEGSLNFLEFLQIDGCFPSKFSRKIAKIKSTFANHLELIAIKFIPNDTRFEFEVQYSRNFPILINPKGVTQIGFIKYFPGNKCEDSLSDLFITAEKSTNSTDIKVLSQINDAIPCYVGFGLKSKIGSQWLKGISLDYKVIEYDHFIYKRLKTYWDLLVSREKHNFNITLQMDTSTAKGFLNTVNIQMTWPSLLLSNKEIMFPLTQIGNYSINYIQLENPSEKPILIQLVLLTNYAEVTKFMELFGLDINKFQLSESDTFSFYCGEDDLKTNYHQDILKKHAQLHSMFSMSPHNKSITFLLKPRMKRKIKICFNPSISAAFKIVQNYLIIRNNLTSIEYISLKGEGSYGELSFQNGLNQESLILHFELTEKHLKNCDIQSKGIPSFTVRRPFVIKNIGKIPVFISGFKFAPYYSDNNNIDTEFISDFNNDESKFPTLWENVNRDVINRNENTWCTGYGFEVVECGGYNLDVNQSLKLEIVFTPDFSLHKVVQQLQIHTSLSPWSYNVTVQASLPSYMLHRCSQALARPDIEILIWYMAVVVITLILISAMLVSYYEADRIFTSNVIYRHFSSVALGAYSNSPNDSVLFDLKNCESRNSFYSLYNDNSKNTIHDYLSFYNQHSETNTICRRKSSLRKSDVNNNGGKVADKCNDVQNTNSKKSTTTIYEKSNSSNDINTSTENHDPLFGNYIQQRRKRKRSFITSTFQWLFKYFTLLISRNQVLKPKLDGNFISDQNTSSKFINSSTSSVTAGVNTTSNGNYNNNSKSQFVTHDHNQTTFVHTNNTNCNGAQQGNNGSVVNNSSNNANTINKKPKKNTSNSFVTNSNKHIVYRLNEQSLSPLDFDPINIPIVDNKSSNNKKNMAAKKSKKQNTVLDDSKCKSLTKLDENCSFTDSSTDEKIKESENSRQNKNGHDKFEEYEEPITTYRKYSADCNDDTSSIKSVDSEQRSIINKPEEFDSYFNHYNNHHNFTKNNVHYNNNTKNNNKYNWNETDKLGYDIHRDNFKRKINSNDRSQPITRNDYANQFRKPNNNNSNGGNTINYNNNKQTKYQVTRVADSYKCDYESDELIEWENENIADIAPEDIATLSERTECFSLALSGNEPDIRSNECINSKMNSCQDHFGQMDNSSCRINNYQSKIQGKKLNYFEPFSSSFDANHDVKNSYLKQHQFFNNDSIQLANNPRSNYMSLELPGIAQGRKQSLLEYERRSQMESYDIDRHLQRGCVKNYINPHNQHPHQNHNQGTKKFMKGPSDMDHKYWESDERFVYDGSEWNTPNDSHQNISNEPMNNNHLWGPDKLWNQVKPGSEDDFLAQNLIPTELFGENTVGRVSTTNLWKFKTTDPGSQSKNVE